jgi:hypothetical protein
MVITRSAFESIERNFPIASRLVLENLKRRSEAQVGFGQEHRQGGWEARCVGLQADGELESLVWSVKTVCVLPTYQFG